MLWTLLSVEIPIAPARNVMYELSGLILGLLPIILIIPATGGGRIVQFKTLFSDLDLWAKGFFLVLICVVFMSAYSLSLRFLLPDTASGGIGAVLVNWLIILLKWCGLGMLSWSQLRALWKKTLTAENDAAKRKSRIVYGLVSVLLIVLVAYFAWYDVSVMIGDGIFS